MILRILQMYEDVLMPTKGSSMASGLDVYAYGDPVITENYIQYHTGLKIEPDPGYDVKLFPRSSISNYDLVLANSIGLIDEDYRGEILFRFKPLKDNPKIYKKGDKIGQLVVQKREIVEVHFINELTFTDRGSGGFGSTGL